jgi:nitrilase
MPLLRYSLYSQNVNLYLAPTADFRETWLPLMRTVAFEGRTVVMSANQCLRRKHQPDWIRSGKKEKSTGIGMQQQSSQVVNGEHVGKRKCSITKTEDNHEVAWPSPESRATRPKADGTLALRSPAIIDGDEDPILAAPLARRESIVTRTEDNHRIQWPACKNERSNSKTEEADTTSALPATSPLRQHMAARADSDALEQEDFQKENSISEPRPRRSSLVTRTEDNHEITWPPCSNMKASSFHTMSTPQPLVHDDDGGDEIVSRGGSCIISPLGKVLAGPLWDIEDELLITDVDFEDCERGRLDLDVAGHYSRSDSFKLKVEGLDLNPPP